MYKKRVIGNNYNVPIEIAEGIFWIGYFDEEEGLHCNPYMIIEGEEVVLIDSGSRNDFSSVMMKILQTGVNPSKISRLIFHHYDPDLCSSIPHFEEIIDNKELKIISHKENNIFIKYYASTSPRLCIENMEYKYTFASGRELRFIKTPYSHSAGSFVTFDTQTGTLLSSDLFGCYGRDWGLYVEFGEVCGECTDYSNCKLHKTSCHIKRVIDFHKRIMTSTKALRYALDRIKELGEISQIAPQHGSIIYRKEDIETIIEKLYKENNIGIDDISGDENGK